MIYLNNTIISSNLVIESVTGLYDFPKMKASPRNWEDKAYIDFDDSKKTWQFESRTIKFNCMIYAATYTSAVIEFEALKDAMNFDGLAMMTVPSYSNRAFLVYHSKSAKMRTRYEATNTVFRFSLEFIEPQPFNIQFFYDTGSSPEALTLSIGKAYPGESTASERQKYINVWFQGVNTKTNIEHGTYDFDSTIAANTRHHCIVTGEIDEVDYIFSTIVPSYKDIADYYMRSGDITTAMM